jgi:hypothetical protein
VVIERWPPIYDAEGLAATIDAIVRDDRRPDFYAPSSNGGACCQGDVLRLDSGVPVIEADGQVVEIDDFSHWLVIGNTCDFDRSEVVWTQVVPVTVLDRAPPAELAAYRGSRRFFLPSWDGSAPYGAAADFQRPVALAKSAVGASATVVARLSRPGWVLLHSCLVRFLARDDGRFDP